MSGYEGFCGTFFSDVPVFEVKGQDCDTDAAMQHLFHTLGKRSYSAGLYKICDSKTSMELTDSARQFDVAARFFEYSVFAFDWQGKLYFYKGRSRKTEAKVVCLDLETFEEIEFHRNLCEFHNDVLVKEGRDILDEEKFGDWTDFSGESLLYDQIVAPSVPLMASGSDDIDKLNVETIEVYVYTMFQWKIAIDSLPEGAPIGNITINEKK